MGIDGILPIEMSRLAWENVQRFLMTSDDDHLLACGEEIGRQLDKFTTLFREHPNESVMVFLRIGKKAK